MTHRPTQPLTLAVVLSLSAGCVDHSISPADAELLFGTDPRILQPEPAAEPLVHLGARLFHDARLSKDGETSCATCHDVRGHHGQNGRSLPVACGDDVPRTRNVGSVVDTGRLVTLGWEGATVSVEDMVRQALDDPHRIGIPDDESLRALVERADANDPTADHLGARFASAFGTGDAAVSRDHYAEAVAAYLRTLRTHGRWDRFVEGDANALTADERDGLLEFIIVGCAACHGSRLLGGVSTHPLGVAEPYPTDDPGRVAATGQEKDRHVFRAPPLRLVAHTAPYFHDGSVATLEEAIDTMARVELGKQLTDDQVRSIATFLRAAGDVAPIAGAPVAAPTR